MKSIVSVIVPAYNVQDYLAECIESVLNQTFTAWELIIVNDGSTDDTLLCAQQYAAQDPRISVITQKNGGVSAARNTGLFAAKGKYVSFLDGDDYWEPIFLEKLVGALRSSRMEIAYCGYNRVYSNGFVRPYHYKYPSGDILIPPKNEPVQLVICAMIFSKDFLDKHQITFTVGGRIGEDWEMICKAIALTEVQSVPMNLMVYRQRSGSALHSGWDWKVRIHSLQARKRVINYIAQKGSEVVNSEAKLMSLKRRLSYKAFRFLWRVLKVNGRAQVRELIRDEEFLSYLSNLDVKSFGFVDRLKYWVIMSVK